jgi:protein-disulfide isomerase
MKRITLWIAFFAIIGLLVWGIAVASKKNKVVEGVLGLPVSTADWSIGSSTAKAVLVEYADLQCPACAAYNPMVKRVVEAFPNDLQLVYRHFPLITIHMNADYAAGAAEAAGKQGKFWEMHDLLFDKQADWERSPEALKLFADYATSLGLDVKKFNSDVVSMETRKKINDSYRSGVQAGVKGTPTFFLNGKMIENPRSEEEFKDIIKNAIASTTVSN